MIRIAIVGGIGSGKTYISNLFGYPVFNADKVVSRIYSSNDKIFYKLKKKLPKFFLTPPIKKEDLIRAILKNRNNIKIISKIVHPEVRKELKKFLKKHNNKKAIVLDIPLLLENNLNKKKDVIVFIHSSQKERLKRIKSRKNFNNSVFQKLKRLQLPLDFKKKDQIMLLKIILKKTLFVKMLKI